MGQRLASHNVPAGRGKFWEAHSLAQGHRRPPLPAHQRLLLVPHPCRSTFATMAEAGNAYDARAFDQKMEEV